MIKMATRRSILDFSKSLAEGKTTRDRTHRERKELYIKALEDEVLRLKELSSNTSQSKERLVTEHKYLKILLTQRGIPFPPSGDHDDGPSPGAAGASSNNSAAPASYASFSPGSQSGALTGQSANFQSMSGQQMRGASQQPSKKGVDFEQAGIDFVLTYDNSASSWAYLPPPPGLLTVSALTDESNRLEKPCMQHLPFLTTRSEGGDPCGHALMKTFPPAPFSKLSSQTPFGHSHTRDYGDKTNPGQGTWEISIADLSTLLDLSHKLDLDGEITPVMAWGMILNHPRFGDLKAERTLLQLLWNWNAKLGVMGLVLLWRDLSFGMLLRASCLAVLAH
ncbi:hypothetical protein C2857_001309 [Epichloe festucae Fl1]|uniref:BZIP domain-containing protein n=1 Tax=Epichloe festucae (strain Fl1) TaxID=877507 RepID=A0A7S9PV43_EPIFF|nr:hypothetical protein C2857_001309 [Epichloe festucae Fl1]